MKDREKVVKKLEELLEQSRFNDSVGWNPDCDTETLEDAIALLKAQEPRVMSLAEYKALAEKPKEERDPVWEEWPRLESTWAIPNQAYGGYGTSWRCWTSRPTDEQREAVKWE